MAKAKVNKIKKLRARKATYQELVTRIEYELEVNHNYQKQIEHLKQEHAAKLQNIEVKGCARRNDSITNWVQSIADLNSCIAKALGEGLFLRSN